ELAPAHAVVPVENQRRMGVALSDSLFLRGTVVRRVGPGVFGVEPHAPAPAKDAIVALHQRGERGPRRLVESLHGVRGSGHKAQPNGATTPVFSVPNQKRRWVSGCCPSQISAAGRAGSRRCCTSVLYGVPGLPKPA